MSTRVAGWGRRQALPSCAGSEGTVAWPEPGAAAPREWGGHRCPSWVHNGPCGCFSGACSGPLGPALPPAGAALQPPGCRQICCGLSDRWALPNSPSGLASFGRLRWGPCEKQTPRDLPWPLPQGDVGRSEAQKGWASGSGRTANQGPEDSACGPPSPPPFSRGTLESTSWQVCSHFTEVHPESLGRSAPRPRPLRGRLRRWRPRQTGGAAKAGGGSGRSAGRGVRGACARAYTCTRAEAARRCPRRGAGGPDTSCFLRWRPPGRGGSRRWV